MVKRYLIVALVVGIVLCAGYALAVAGVSHSLSELQSCPAGKILKSDASGAWSCGDVSSSQWQDGSGGIIYYNGGNVGIGTLNPETKLQVGGGHIMIDNSNALRSKTAAGAIVDLAYISNTDQYGYANSAIAVSGGNVGIGTTSPAYKLDISGDVRWTGTLQGGSVPWARLSGFPSACPAGQYVRAVGTTLTCSTPPTGGHGDGSNCNAGYAPLGVDANGNAQGCWDVAAESHNHDSAYVNVGGDTMTGQLTVSINSAEGGSLRLANPGKNADWVLYNMRGSYGNSFQIWNYPGGTPASRFVITDNGKVGIGVSPSIDFAVEDADSGIQYVSNRIEIMKDNVARMRIYGDDSGTYFYDRNGNQKLVIGGVGTGIYGNLIVEDNRIFQFPSRDSEPYACESLYRGQAYVRTQSPQILCVCSSDGSSWKWFGTANGNEYVCAE